MNGAALGRYIPGDSFVHRLDPRCKLACTVVLMGGILSACAVADFVIWAAVICGITAASKISIKVVLRSVRPVVFLAVVTMTINLFWTKGEPALVIGPVTIAREGIVLATAMCMRLFAIIIIASMMMFTTSPMALADGFERIFHPFSRVGFPASEMAMMMTIALRFIPTLFEETERIIRAQRSRGADLETGGIIKRIKNYIPIFIPLFVLVFKRAENLAVAMEARCYVPGADRTRMRPLVWRSRDSAALLLCACCSVGAAAADRMLLGGLIA